MIDRPQPPGPKKLKKKKKRPPPVYVEVQYPYWLGVVSVAWAAVGWLIAAAAPHLAFVPLIGVLHYLFPAVTIGLIGANLYFALRDLRRGAHVLRLLVVTGLQVALFTTLFFQLFAHVGAELYDVSGPTSPLQWVHFSLAHAFRAGDVVDLVEAFGMKVQPIKHSAALVALFVVLYHVVVDVFFLGLLFDVIGRVRRRLLEDEGIASLVYRTLAVAFVAWFLTWVVVALWVYPWRGVDIPLWLLENFIRVVDFADVMESFNLHLHGLPRGGVVGLLTVLCRIWIIIGLAMLLAGGKKRDEVRRVVTPPDVDASAYWWRRVGVLTGLFFGLLATALIGHAVLGNPAGRLAAAVGEGPEGRSRDALRALRRMGPAAKETVATLVETRAGADPAVRDEITRTLGYLGADAADPLADIALAEEGSAALAAVEGLGEIGAGSAPELARVWQTASAEPTRERADRELRRLGREAVPPLMAATTIDNAEAHYHWFKELDPNWKLRGTDNQVARSLQRLPDLIARLQSNPDAETTAEILSEIRGCGNAAREVLPEALKRINTPDNNVRAQCEGILVAVGPSLTPGLLKQVDGAGQGMDAGLSGVVSVLNHDRMWNDAVRNDPATLPTLLKLVTRQDAMQRQIAVRHLGYYGPKAKEAVPSLVASLGSPDESTRAEMREVLAKVDPEWKKHPALNSAIPLLLSQLGALPKEEADELFAAFGDLPADEADKLAEVLVKRIHDRDAPGVPGRGVPFDPKAYGEHLDRVFAPVERLGPRLRAAVPALRRKLLSQSFTDLANNPHYRVLRTRAIKALESIASGGREDIGLMVSMLGHDQEALNYVKQKGPAALPALRDALKSQNSEARLFALKAAASLREVARPLVPDLIAMLRNANVHDRVEGRDVWMLAHIVERLIVVDKDWWGHPEAARQLGDLVARPTLPEATTGSGDNRPKLLQLITAAGPAGKPLAGPLAAQVLAKGTIDEPLRKVLDHLDPDWRTQGNLKSSAAELVKKMNAGIDIQTERTLVSLGAQAVPALVEGLAAATPTARERIFVVLAGIGPAGKEAVPALVKAAADPGLPVPAARQLLDALRTVDPKWSTDPGRKDEATRLVAALLKRGEAESEFIGLAGKVGPPAVPELVKRLGNAKPAQRHQAVIGLGEVGPGTKEALAALKKVLRDTDVQGRRLAVEALGKVGRGDEDLIPVVAPALIDPDASVRNAAPSSLQEIDPNWKKSPKLKETVSQVLKALANPNAKTRQAALAALGQIGPAEGAVPALEKMLKQEKDADNLRLAQALLDRFRRGG